LFWGTPVLAMALTLVAPERVFHLGVFNPALWRPAVVPAFVLVLFPPGGLYHDPTGDGAVSEIIPCFHAGGSLIQLYRRLAWRSR
jgi:hypothetical protein